MASWVFPRIVPQPLTVTEQLARIRSELEELEEVFYGDAVERNARVVEECQDVMHAVETLLRMLSDRTGLDPEVFRLDVIEKNRRRGYYGGDGEAEV